MASAVDLRVSADAAAAIEAAASHIVRSANATIGRRGSVHIGFSGGSTGALLLRALAHESLDWAKVFCYQVDERVAPDGDPGRNATAMHAELLDIVPVPARNVVLMDVTASDLAAAAHAYAAALPALDLVHLGLGSDGHTASWPPDQPDVRTSAERVAITGLFNEFRRMTLTQRAVAEAHHVVWLVCGDDKRDALARSLAGDQSLPAAHALSLGSRHLDHVMFADEAAAG